MADSRLSCRLLIEAEDVAVRVAKSCGDLGGVRTDGSKDFAAIGDNRVQRRGHAIDHDGDADAVLTGWRAAQHPHTADLANAVVEGKVAIAAVADIPAKDFFVK